MERKANETVTEYALEQTRQAIDKVEGLIKGEGCTCRNCTLNAVREVNKWLAFTENRNEEVFYRYEILPDLTVSLIALDDRKPKPKSKWKSVYDDLVGNWDDDLPEDPEPA